MRTATTHKTLYVITSVFNPFRFRSRYRLYKNFKQHMEESGVKLFTVEVAFGDDPFVVTDATNPMHLQLRSNQILWHKERLLNLGFAMLKHRIPEVAFIGMFDADVTFVDGDWAGHAVHALSYLHVIQPFAQAINLNKQEEAMWFVPSTLCAYIERRGYHQEPELPTTYTNSGHPGLAWCYTRAALDGMGGLYDMCIAGSADSVMANAFKGDWRVYLPGKPTAGMIASMAAWSQRAQKVVDGQVGFIRGAIMHHWHGASESRGYEKRWDILSFHRFDPAVDVVVAENGMHAWTGSKPGLRDDIRLSLSGRDEDA